MATAVTISRDDMVTFLTSRNFTQLQIAGTKEMVFGRIVDKGLCLRVYTSIAGEESRGVGADAIRCVLFTKLENGDVKMVGVDKRVHRVEGWKANLQNRLDTWREMLGPRCPICGKLTTRRKSRRGYFWGCIGYPTCRGIVNIGENLDRALASVVDSDDDPARDSDMEGLWD